MATKSKYTQRRQLRELAIRVEWKLFGRNLRIQKPKYMRKRRPKKKTCN